MQTLEQDRFILAADTIYRTAVKVFWYLTSALGLLFILYPIITKQYLSRPIWLPNLEADEREVAGYIHEVLCFVILISCYAPLDCVFVRFICILSVQIQILKDNLRQATNRDIDEDFETQECKIQDRLKVCIIHNNAILE
ncbi:hypothetical protein Trydic_g2956 [Trypoxylus dichotomus]